MERIILVIRVIRLIRDKLLLFEKISKKKMQVNYDKTLQFKII